MHTEYDRGRSAAITAACLILGTAFYMTAVAGAQAPQPGNPGPARCRVEGSVVSGGVPLPGASVIVRVGSAVRASTSTDLDGKFAVLFAPNSSYHLTVDLMAFATAERDITLGPAPCDTTVQIPLTLRPKGEAINQPTSSNQPAAANAPAAGSQQQAAAGSEPAAGGQTADNGAQGGGRGRGRGGRGGAQAGAQTAQAGRGAQRFQTLDVQADQNAATDDTDTAATDDADVERLLPAGFSLDAAQASAVAINDSGDATSVDRGALGDRFQAIAGGQFDPATGQFAPGAAPGGAPGQFGGAPGQGGPGGPGGRGGGPGGRGGGPGRGGFQLAGRGARSQSPYQGSVNYTFGGSILNAPPFQLNSNVAATQPQYAQNNAGFTIGGPVKIPGIYADTNRRTNFQLNYQGTRSNNVSDQYANVPTSAERAGDFSASSVQLVNPKTGQPFPGNQIPTSAMDPASLALLPYIPAPNITPNGSPYNYHLSTLAHTSNDAVSLRFTQNLSRTVQQGGRGGRGGGGFGGGRGGPGGRAGRGPVRGTNVVLNAQMQYRRSDTQSVNIFPNLGGDTTTTSLAAPISLNIVHGRTVNNITFQVTHSDTSSTNAFSGVTNVAGLAGLQYPTASATEPLNWGVPNLSFTSGFTGLRGAGASMRTDDRITTGYVWSHSFTHHQVRAGVDYRFDTTETQLNSNPRGTFTYTGVYAGNGLQTASGTGADFADFLLGAPTQAQLQVGGTSHLHGKSYDAYVEDNWQKSSKLTFNLGLRYELALPYVSVNGQMANLDVAPGFTAVSPVYPGGVGPYSGAFPAGLINPDRNNIGPRVGMAYRATSKTILRAGYSITYNPGSYATIARQLAAQPPFSTTATVNNVTEVPGAVATVIPFETLLLNTPAPGTSVTDNYGVDKDYSLGEIQTWNATVTHNLTPVWSVVAGYTGIKGTDLDLLSVPNRVGPDSLLIPAAQVEPYTWESSGAHSILNQGNFQLIRRLAHGVSGSASYTLSRSMDDSPSLGGGGGVAQDPQNLGAEWALSNFNRTNQFTGNLYVELPWGTGRRWLRNGGFFGNVIGDWAASLTYTAMSGTPLTPTVTNAFNVTQGAPGALRADYTGAPIALSDPSVGQFFNTAAFVAPPLGSFGDASRNMIIGPGSHQLNGQLIRDIRLGGVRALTLNVVATNLLNTELFGSINTNVSALANGFGSVTSFRPARTVTINARFRF